MSKTSIEKTSAARRPASSSPREKTPRAERPEPVGSVSKAFEVLRAFVDGQDQWGVRELAPVLNLPRSTVHRMLVRLRLDGFLQYNESARKYRLGFQFFRLAAAAFQRSDQMQAVDSVLRELSRLASEDALFALYDVAQNRVACIAGVTASRYARPSAPIGREEQLTDSAFGLSILAELDPALRKAVITDARTAGASNLPARLKAIAEHGYAVMSHRDSDEIVIAAVIRGPDRAIVGSLGLKVPARRCDVNRERTLGQELLARARDLEYRLAARFLGGSSSGSWHEAVALITEALQQRNPSIAVAPALGGGFRNLEELEQGRGSYALTTAASLYDAVQGRGRFERPLQNLRAVMKLSDLHLHVIANPRAKLSEVGDLVGLRVCPGEERYSSAHAFEDLLQAAKVSKAKLEREGAVLYLDLPEARRQFQSGALDVMLWLAARGTPLVRGLEAEHIAVLRGFPRRVLDLMVESNPGYRVGMLDPETYPEWLQEPLATLVDPTVLVCSANCSNEEVHEVAETVFEARAQLASRAAAQIGMDEDFALSGLTAPLHPGAEQYFTQLRQPQRRRGRSSSTARGD